MEEETATQLPKRLAVEAEEAMAILLSWVEEETATQFHQRLLARPMESSGDSMHQVWIEERQQAVEYFLHLPVG